MKIYYLKLIILITLINPYVISISHAESLRLDSIKLSPRDFCLNTNGTVTETGVQHIYICCYSGKQKCIINNEKRGYSRLIILRHTGIEGKVKQNLL